MRLRQYPDWAAIPDDEDEVRAIDTQDELAYQVEELLTDIEHGPTATLNATDARQPEDTVEEELPATADEDPTDLHRTGEATVVGGDELPDMAVLVLRALPGSSNPALGTLAQIAAKVGLTPRPSVSSVSRAIKKLRRATPPLVDAASYRRTAAGDEAVAD